MKHIVITIGREYGSGGRLIAKQLSEEMGITFYDKQLISDVAKKTGFSENFIRTGHIFYTCPTLRWKSLPMCSTAKNVPGALGPPLFTLIL